MTPDPTDAEMVRIVARIAETRRQLQEAEDARERRPLPEWTVTVEYIPHAFNMDPQLHTVESISALDEESAIEQAYAEVRALEDVTVREIVKATAVRVENIETASKVLDLMAALKASLAGGSPEQVRAAACVSETPADNLATARTLHASLSADFPPRGGDQ